MTYEERRDGKRENRKCKVCGNVVRDEWTEDFCENCGWIWDIVQERDADYTCGMNDMSLNEAKEAYSKGEAIH